MMALPIPSDTWITYEATIKGYENCTWVTYKIIAYDNAGNNATKDNNGYGYKYHVIPEFPTTSILILLILITLITTTLWKTKRKTSNSLNCVLLVIVNRRLEMAICCFTLKIKRIWGYCCGLFFSCFVY
jgi:hypothetical protein